MRLRLAFALAAFLLLSTDALSQGLITPSRPARTQKNEQGKPLDAASQSSADKSPLPSALPVAQINIKARIEGQVATVTVEHRFRNDTDEQLEGTYYFPVPEGATLLEFAIYDGDERRVGRVKDKEEARAQYDAAVSQGEDPAILEMTRRGWFQSRVYPIPARSEKRVEIIYSQVLPDKNGVVSFDYPLGRGYKKLKVPVDRVDIEVSLSSAVAITNVFSPTHPLEIEMDGDRRARCKITTMGGGDAENFQLVYTLSDEEINATLITHRREGEDGYFLLMLSPKVEFKKERISAKNTIFVVDVSGSMVGEKLSQAKEALRFGITRTLNENDRFNIIAFSSGIISMSPQLLDVSPLNIARARDFIDNLKAEGATNINDSLIAAMQMFEAGARAQNLVFITDGHPTESVRYTDQIAANVRAANKTRVRLFTFGVGVDLNRLLLEKLAAENRGASLDITDYSQLATTLSTFFSKVSQPVLSDLQVDFGPVIVTRSHPAQLPDLYTRTQIKIFGRYSNLQELEGVTIALGGRMNEEWQRFEFGGLRFPLVTDDKGYLPKLWATERVNALLADIRLNGETLGLKQEVVELARQL